MASLIATVRGWLGARRVLGDECAPSDRELEIEKSYKEETVKLKAQLNASQDLIGRADDITEELKRVLGEKNERVGKKQ